jgi:hypothetical protein
MGEEAWDPALRPIADVGTISVTLVGPAKSEQAASGPEDASQAPLDGIAWPQIPAWPDGRSRRRCVWVY